MSDNNSNYDVLVPAGVTKWIALAAGLLLPLFFAAVAAGIYGGGDRGGSVQVYPLPEE